MKPFMSACLIVKNEEEMLGKCLNSLESVVDEIIIVDTGSTDKTKEIAKKFTDKVYDFKWTNNFAEARNFAASKASGKWIIAVDADECIDVNNFVAAMEEIKSYKDKISIFLVEIMSFVGESGEEITVNTMARLYKNDGSVYFTGAIHEQLETKNREANLAKASIKLYHYGYMPQVVEKKDKKNRNLKIIKQDLKNKKNHGFSYFNYGQELRRLGKTKEALKNFVKAYKYKVSVDEGWVRTCLFFIVECLVELKRYEEALNIVRDTESLWPASPDFTFWKGDIYFLQKRYDDAREVYESILLNNMLYEETIYHFDRKSFLPHERLGRICEIEKNDEQAIQHYIEARNENTASVNVIERIIYILSKYHTASEVYEFIKNQNLITTNKAYIYIVKYILNIGLAELAKLMGEELVEENKELVRVIQLKSNIITASYIENEGIVVEKKDILFGIEIGIFDLADLCILYEITKDENVKNTIIESNFEHVFKDLFIESNKFKRIKPDEYLAIIGRAVRYNKSEFVERLMECRYVFKNDINAKLADIFFENGYEEIALDLYQLVNCNQLTKIGYINIIKGLINQQNFEEAWNVIQEAINKFHNDYRFYKYAILLDNNNNKDFIIGEALEKFPDSKWLKKQLTN
ncbi:tetratricopeptide repeat-containing glycosyltransferase family 2 protein [Bacillus cereus]|uniref:Glycosyltransferase 2-like domain-containing protein n=1 Tax=Bacillus cereus VD184 TaxID=1053242 RepID=A0A9W5VTX8_BACCE|nr:glycosyltransferase [Bacillus cereus]EOQ16898.1 hypothetical protein IKC_02348 [Bacillus cereus VD184]